MSTATRRLAVLVLFLTISTAPPLVAATFLPRIVGAASAVSAKDSVQVVITPGAGSITTSSGYSPDVVTVVIGVNNTITWTNDDSFPHTITARNGAFDSNNLDAGQSYTYTFTTIGVYNYYCRYHYWMHGTVIVKAAPTTITTTITSTTSTSTNAPPSRSGLVREFELPTPGAYPFVITAASNGLIWFTENNLGKIGSFNPQTGSWNEYRSPSLPLNSSFPAIGFQMYTIATDSSGNIWFTSWEGDQLVRFNPQTETFTPYVLGPGNFTIQNREPYGLLVLNNTVWFSEYNGEAIGKLDIASGSIQTYKIDCNCVVGPLAQGLNNTIWFTIPESAEGKIGVFNPVTGKFEIANNLKFNNGENSMDSPTGIAVDSHGHVWVTDHASDTIYELGPSLPSSGSSVTAYWNTPLPGAAQRTEPFGIATDAQGNVWFAEQNANRIGVLNPSGGTLTEYVLPTNTSFPSGVAIDGQGRVWFTESTGNKLGMIQPRTPLPFSISLGSKNITLQEGATESIDVLLDTLGNYTPGGPLKIWVNGIPFQDIRLTLGSTQQISQNQFRVQLLLNLHNSLPVGTYSGTVSVASPSLIQAVVVNFQVMETSGGLILLLGSGTGFGLVVLVSAVVLTVAGVAATRGGSGRSRYRKHLAVVVIALFVVASLSIVYSTQTSENLPFQGRFASQTRSTSQISNSQNNRCGTVLTGSEPTRVQLSNTHFGAVTEFALPRPGRAPNAVAVAPDGSVWFGEQNLTGIAHLFPNGTLVEYPWPSIPAYGAPPYTCAYKTAIWGIAFWEGRVWASDDAGNQLVGVNPSTGSIVRIEMPGNNSDPFTLTVGPDNSLWIPEILADEIGRVFPNGTLVQYPVPQSTGGVPADLIFVNGTGYFVTNGVYEFPPNNFTVRMVSTPKLLYFPIGISYGDGGVWVAQHGTSNVIFYSARNDTWITYPTSTLNYTVTTLPYFVIANGSTVWFNEHYGNRIARINVDSGTMIEYSESDPPVTSGFDILNTQTFALGSGRVWFASVTGNIVGYVNASYRPSFSISTVAGSTIRIAQGATGELMFDINGSSSSPLSLQFSDSESFSSHLQDITINSSVNGFPSLSGSEKFSVSITVGKNLAPGAYTLVFTVTDGLVYQSKFVTLYVSG